MTSEATCILTQMDTDLVSPQSTSQKCPGTLPHPEGQEKWLCIPWSDSELYSTYKGLDNHGQTRCLRSNQRYRGPDTTAVVLPTEFSVKYDCRYVHFLQFTIFLYTLSICILTSIYENRIVTESLFWAGFFESWFTEKL